MVYSSNCYTICLTLLLPKISISQRQGWKSCVLTQQKFTGVAVKRYNKEKKQLTD